MCLFMFVIREQIWLNCEDGFVGDVICDGAFEKVLGNRSCYLELKELKYEVRRGMIMKDNFILNIFKLFFNGL